MSVRAEEREKKRAERIKDMSDPEEEINKLLRDVAKIVKDTNAAFGVENIDAQDAREKLDSVAADIDTIINLRTRNVRQRIE